MSDSEVKLFYAQNSEVSKRILAPDEHLRAIDTGAYYVEQATVSQLWD